MYCSKCGYQIKKGNNKCLNCGEITDSAEFCGGFWGLVGKDMTVEPVEALSVLEDVTKDTAVFEEGNETMKIVTDDKEKKMKTRVKKKKSFPFVLLICIVLICISAWTGVELSKLEKNYTSLNEEVLKKYDELNEKIDNLEQEVESMESEYKELEETDIENDESGEDESGEDYSGGDYPGEIW